MFFPYSPMKVKSFSCVQLFRTPWAVAYQAPPSMGLSRQKYWSGLPFPSPGDLPNPGIKLGSPALQADALPSELHSSKPRKHGEYEVPTSTGFSVVTKHGHKVAAFLPAPLLGFLLFVFQCLFSVRVELISDVFVLSLQELGLVMHERISILFRVLFLYWFSRCVQQTSLCYFVILDYLSDNKQ